MLAKPVRVSLLILFVFGMLALSPFLHSAGAGLADMILLQLAVFILPTGMFQMLKGTRPDARPLVKRMRLGLFRLRDLPFIFFASAAVTLCAAVLNCLVLLFPAGSTPAAPPQTDSLIGVLAYIAAPALCEELFMRSTVLEEYEQCGTVPAIFLSALMFAMLHASFANFLGPLAAGIAYAYMTYVLDSVWPAVLAHMFNNAFSLYAFAVLERLLPDGKLLFALAAGLLAFLLFTYLALRSHEKMIARSGWKPMQPPPEGSTLSALLALLFHPLTVVIMIFWVLRCVFF